jgi:hypothetical protein
MYIIASREIGQRRILYVRATWMIRALCALCALYELCALCALYAFIVLCALYALRALYSLD